MRFDSGRTRLYFCPQCGTLVGCVRKKRCNPGRKCKLERCIDFVKCRLRAIYENYNLVKEKIFCSSKGYRRFHKKYSLHFVDCDRCRS
jgi:hypothetical protein